MKRCFILAIMLAIAGLLFADVTVDSESTYDLDAKTLKETIDTSVGIGALTLNNKFVFANLLLDKEVEEEMSIAWDAEIAYAITEAISAGFKAEFGDIVDEAGTAKLEFNGSWTVTDMVSARAKYVIDNANTPEGEDAEKGAFTFGAKFSF